MPHQLWWLAYLIAGLTIMVLLANAVLLNTAVFQWMERRLLGRFQVRFGPNRVGPFGLLQPFADLLKLLLKEDIVPEAADRFLFTLAPAVMAAPVFLVLAVVPFGKNSYLLDLNIGLLYIIAVGTLSTMVLFLAGWGSGNRYALFGATRAVAQLISYEVPMVLSLVGVLLLAGSLSLVQIVEAQRLPFLLLQPLGFFIFAVASIAEMNRGPFDLVEAESEIVAGYHTEYSGIRFGLLQLGEYAAASVPAAVIATVFLRGWANPFVPLGWPDVLPSHLWFFLKVFLVLFLFIWVRATVPRLRIDQVMGFAWKFLLPLALVNIFVTAIEVQLWRQPTTAQLWAMVLVNWVVAAVAVGGLSRAMERHRRRPTASVAPVPISVEVR
ncbi:MAG: NADH-quinone oxidoreductase subunit NuoH [Chloroflexi bacterium]|nr:NADH-quinone oxidoreductase subunit NuoH [Chloroflexota bacterium]